MNALICILLLALGNFGYEATFGDSDWLAATYTTFMQAFAVMIYVFFWEKI